MRAEALTAVRTPLSWTLAPERAALLVRDDARPFALIGRWAGGGALIGSEPVRVASPDDDPFALLDQQPLLAGSDTAGAVAGGWFGYLGYELGRGLEPIGASPPTPTRLPPFELAFYDHLLRLDADGRWWFEALRSDARAAALRERLHKLEARAAKAPRPRPFSTDAWRATPGVAGHELAVQACRDRIYAGDLFQANVCVRLQSRLRGDAVDLFAAGVRGLRPDRAAFLAGPWGAVASLSPELFLERHGRRVRSAPIKGTRRRPSDPALGAREREALLASEKDRAENVMIVDLVRNDLGRVSVPGSVQVDALADARAHTGVWHLVSEVSAKLPEGVRDAALVRAAFPPGSVTGAPKVAALNVIAELESTARHVYTGAIGFASPVAGLELSVAIRTFEFRGECAWLGVGGGIVAESDPSGEAAECVTKARPLLDAIGGSLVEKTIRVSSFSAGRGDGGVSAPLPARVGPAPIPRPDPSEGIFETLLVADGRAVALERHLSRLEQSGATLYGCASLAGLAEEIAARASGAESARLRVNLRPTANGVAWDLVLSPLTERDVPVRLIPRTLPGGLGAHKWIDRRLLQALTTDEGEPLLCDLDGFVLEAARANVFILQEGRLITPPTDGRILPGVSRARVLGLAPRLGLDVEIRPIQLSELECAGELFITGSLGGVEPAHLDGPPFHSGPLTEQLAEALRELEFGTPAATGWDAGPLGGRVAERVGVF